MSEPMRALPPIWHEAGLAPQTLAQLSLGGTDPVLPSSFAVGTAAQTTLAAAALAATELGHHRNGVCQQVQVDMRHAALECCGHFTIDGRVPEVWDRTAGLYRCAGDGWVRLHKIGRASCRERVCT